MNHFSRWMLLFLLIALLSPLALTPSIAAATRDTIGSAEKDKKKPPRKPQPTPGPRENGDGDS